MGFAVAAVGQTGSNDQQQQPPPTREKNTKSEQTTEQPAGPSMGHSDREQMKDTSQPTRMKSGGTDTSGGAVQTTSVFRNGKQTAERLSLHRGTRDQSDTHFAVGSHPRDWWLRTYSIVLISGCHYYLADNGCWYPAYGFDPSCNFPEGVVYCD